MLSRPLVSAILLFISISALGADWPQFRGADRSNISSETGLLRSWPAEGPKVLWKTPVCEGYSGAAIKDGRIYINDYDIKKKEHLVRCISLADGKDIWQWRSPVNVRPSGVSSGRAFAEPRCPSPRGSRSDGVKSGHE